MKVAYVPIATIKSPYECRMCGETVQYTTKRCPNCDIPLPSTERMGRYFITRMAAAATVCGAAGWVAAFQARGSWLVQVGGVLVGIVIGFALARRWLLRHEIVLRVRAFVTLKPEAAGWSAQEIAAAMGTPALSWVAAGLRAIRK